MHARWPLLCLELVVACTAASPANDIICHNVEGTVPVVHARTHGGHCCAWSRQLFHTQLPHRPTILTSRTENAFTPCSIYFCSYHKSRPEPMPKHIDESSCSKQSITHTHAHTHTRKLQGEAAGSFDVKEVFSSHTGF